MNDNLTAALEGKLDPVHLSEEEHDIWFEDLADKLRNPGPDEETFFAKRRELGLGVGLDENDNLVYAKNIMSGDD